MKKVFRMQYEPCNGDCYHPHNVFTGIKELESNPERLKEVTDKLLKIHEPLCGNVNIRYGIDQDVETGLYIATFWHYGKLEMFSNKNDLRLIEELADCVIAYFDSEAGKKELASDPGLGHKVCAYGEDESLREFVLKTANIEQSL